MSDFRAKGFTLLELLVAIAIFALVSVLAYGGLASVLNTRAQTDADARALRSLQQGMQLMASDIEQVIARAIRDEHGSFRPALHGEAGWLEFTRSGWANPGAGTRSELQRVAYLVREQRLVRSHWQVLDRAQDSTPYEAVLLEDMRNLRMRFLDQTGQWSDIWPPLSQAATPAREVTLPRAIEVVIELERWGTVTRLWRLR